MRKILLALVALLFALPAYAQFADQRQYAPTSGGSANAQTVAIPNYNLNVGVVVRFVPGFTNTGAMTLSVNGGTAKSILAQSASGLVALTAGQVQIGQVAQVIYDGTQFELLASSAATNIGNIGSGHVFGNGTGASALGSDTPLITVMGQIGSGLNASVVAALPNAPNVATGIVIYDIAGSQTVPGSLTVNGSATISGLSYSSVLAVLRAQYGGL